MASGVFIGGLVFMIIGLIILLVGIIVLISKRSDCNPSSGKTPPPGCATSTETDPGWYTIIAGIVLFFIGVVMMVWGSKNSKTVKVETSNTKTE